MQFDNDVNNIIKEGDDYVESNKKCYICNKECDKGIDILGSYICRNCEQEMIDEEGSELKREYYKSKVKSLWRNNLS